MTDPETAEALAELTTKTAQVHRSYRGNIITGAATVVVLALADAAAVLWKADRWVMRDLVTIGGLACMALLGWLAATRLLQMVIRLDSEAEQLLRERALQAQAFGPLIEGLREAHMRGAALVIPPPGMEPPADGTMIEVVMAAPQDPPVLN